MFFSKFYIMIFTILNILVEYKNRPNSLIKVLYIVAPKIVFINIISGIFIYYIFFIIFNFFIFGTSFYYYDISFI